MHNLPPQLQEHQGVRQVPIGDVILSLNDTTLAAETCEELFTPQAPHINMYVLFLQRRVPFAITLLKACSI
jgi:NAD+ synthase (glutamine-hydrolysing)